MRLDHAKVVGVARRGSSAEFFGELSLCGGAWILAGLDQPFGEGPSSLVLVGEVGAAHMADQDLDAGTAPTVKGKSGAFAHGCCCTINDWLATPR